MTTPELGEPPPSPSASGVVCTLSMALLLRVSVAVALLLLPNSIGPLTVNVLLVITTEALIPGEPTTLNWPCTVFVWPVVVPSKITLPFCTKYPGELDPVRVFEPAVL